MSTTIGCPIPGASQPKEQRRYIDRPMRLIDAREVMIAVFNAIEMDEDEYNAIKAEVDEIPTIDPESLRPTAHWISDSGGAQMLYVHTVMQFLSLLIIFARSAAKGW